MKAGILFVHSVEWVSIMQFGLKGELLENEYVDFGILITLQSWLLANMCADAVLKKWQLYPTQMNGCNNIATMPVVTHVTYCP